MSDYDKLNKTDKEFVGGFKWCTEMALDVFFDNLNDYSDEFLTHILNEKVPEYLQEEYEMRYSFGEGGSEIRKVETYADLLRMRLLEWCDVELNELIVSMLDSYDEDESDA